MPYRTLNAERIIETAERLHRRIGERFPGSGLETVSGELASIARESEADANAVAEPILWLRLLVAAVIAAGAAVFGLVGTFISFDRMQPGGFDFVQGVEASINTLVLAGIGLITLVRMEDRIKQKRVSKGLHTLRSIIHVVDMHQLTKDPAVLTKGFKPTASSPKRTLKRDELERYLDYCSEMLSLTGKLAALYAQAVNDPVVASAVNDIENLATNLSRKIWQKIMLLESRG